MDKWSYKKPTEPGLYFINDGDVVSPASLEVMTFSKKHNGAVVDSDGNNVGIYHDSWKFMRIDDEYLNSLGNEE